MLICEQHEDEDTSCESAETQVICSQEGGKEEKRDGERKKQLRYMQRCMGHPDKECERQRERD